MFGPSLHSHILFFSILELHFDLIKRLVWNTTHLTLLDTDIPPIPSAPESYPSFIETASL